MEHATRSILVHFYTARSAECQIADQTLGSLAEEFSEEMYVLKVSLDNQPELARRYRVTDVPSLILFDAGVPIAGFALTKTSRELKAHLKGLLADYAGRHACWEGA